MVCLCLLFVANDYVRPLAAAPFPYAPHHQLPLVPQSPQEGATTKKTKHTINHNFRQNSDQSRFFEFLHYLCQNWCIGMASERH